MMLVQKMIRRLGYGPLSCGNGREAVELFQQKSPDLLLMDLQMPEMDGIEATREIRRLEKAASPAQPAITIALTANNVPADRRRCFEAGMNDCLNKPVSIRALADAITQAGGSLESVG